MIEKINTEARWDQISWAIFNIIFNTENLFWKKIYFFSRDCKKIGLVLKKEKNNQKAYSDYLQ